MESAAAELVLSLPDNALIEAVRRGAVQVSIPTPSLGRAAGVSTMTAWRWLVGRPVSAEADAKIRGALGLPFGVERPRQVERPRRKRARQAATAR